MVWISFVIVLLAALFAAIVNFCLRKNSEFQKSPRGYLALYFVVSFLTSFIFHELNFRSISYKIGAIGIAAGLLNLLMMLLIARAVQIGPSGLTFAFQNSASMFPALFLFFVFGKSFGFTMHANLIVGFCLLTIGLFLLVRKEKISIKSFPFKNWLVLAIGILLIQGIILSIFQWRTLLLECPAQNHLLIPWNCSIAEDRWFMPGFFLIPAVMLLVSFFFRERRWFSSRELLLGIIAGIFNGGATFCLLLATRVANPNFRPILFPLFACAVIFLCSLWGKKYYREPIEWGGMAICLVGVLIGSL